MMMDRSGGNEYAKRCLKRSLATGNIGNSLLFAGPKGVGKALLAIEFAGDVIRCGQPPGVHDYKLSSGNHPDIHIYKPEGKIGMHSIDSMRAISSEIYLPPHESRKKVFIIDDADCMVTYSANALLKTFEEPPLDTVIILVSSRPEALLPTIRSRCRTLFFESDDSSFGDDGDVRDLVLAILFKGKSHNYPELKSSVQQIVSVLETSAKDAEEEAASLNAFYDSEDLSAVQRQSIRKEVEGAVSMKMNEKSDIIFDIIISWYRDLHLINSGVDQQYLINRDKKELFPDSVSISLERVLDIIADARLSLARSTRIEVCIENLFLTLGV